MAHWTDDLTLEDIAANSSSSGEPELAGWGGRWDDDDSLDEKIGNWMMGRGWVGNQSLYHFNEVEHEHWMAELQEAGILGDESESEGVNAGLGPHEACDETGNVLSGESAYFFGEDEPEVYPDDEELYRSAGASDHYTSAGDEDPLAF